MRAVVVIIACVAAVLAGPLQNGGGRIYNGELTTIDRYPYAAVMLITNNFVNYFQNCGGSILNERTVLSAAHCFQNERALPERSNVRVGSTFASSGGVVHSVACIIHHPNYDVLTWDNDIAIIKTATNIIQSDLVRFISIAGPNYYPADNDPLWVAGWGATETLTPSEQLRHGQQAVLNQATCQQFYGSFAITDNMLCASGPSSPCIGDSGSPNVHNNNVLVGVVSFGAGGCQGSPQPEVAARVSRYTNWIVENSS